MLALTIVFCFVIFTSAANINQSYDVIESMKLYQLSRINKSLTTIAKSVLNASAIPGEISDMLNREMSITKNSVESAQRKLTTEISSPNEPNGRSDISQCIQLSDQLIATTKSTLRNIDACVIKKVGIDYTRDSYDEIMRKINHCNEDTYMKDSELTLSCYRNVYEEISKDSDKIRKELNFKIADRSKSYIPKTFKACKSANKLSDLREQLLTIADRTEKCIHNARKDGNLLDDIGYGLIRARNNICSWHFLFRSVACTAP